MKRLITSAGLAAVAVTLFVPTMALAQDAAPAAAPADPLSFNIGVVSDYRYRGISQTRLKPALQGGIDYAFPNGFYIGTWASTIKWIKDSGATKGSVELDLYGGYKGAATDALAYDVGLLRYQYVGNKLGDVSGFANANTTEVYGALTFGPATAKLSYAFTNTFGNVDSKGSYYFDLSAGFDVGAGITLTPHFGYQDIHNSKQYSYADYSLTASKEVVPGLTVSLAAVGTNTKKTAGTSYYYNTTYGKNLARSGAVLGLKYAF
jgi:uncharacterized protein (TIGR02001 family)